MITRIYVNNFRALVAFTADFDSMNILCGNNGAGKSSVFDAIKFIASLATENCFFGTEADSNWRTIAKLDFTNCLNNPVQEFEIDLIYNSSSFKYIINLEQQPLFVPRAIKEVAYCNDKEFYRGDLDGVRFDNGRSGFPLDWHQAALASIQPVPERKNIEGLKQAFVEFLVLHSEVHSMTRESKSEAQELNLNMSYCTFWFRFFSQSQGGTDMLLVV